VGNAFRDADNAGPADCASSRQPHLRPAVRRRPPNVLYVVWDDASIATWDVFGGLIDTPNLQQLAAHGLRYSQWHTAAHSSPTRSCLLTGHNDDAGGIARAGRSGSGPRGPGGASPLQAGTLAEILAHNGYRTYCVGKWHLSPPAAPIVAESRETWPLRRGFDRYYGFLGETTSQWDPDLVYDNQHVDPPYLPADGYHLTADLAGMAMEFIRDGAQTAPGRPWLCYLSFGATGIPHSAPREWTGRYRGRFDAGYDRYRETALENMKRLGLVPESTGLARADQCSGAGVLSAHAARPWRSLSQEQQRLSRRLAESAAGLCSYTDHQVGRLLRYLEESGQLEDTIVVACSANATAASLCSAGWEWAFGTPYSMLRQCTPGASAASPLIISSPREMRDVAGGVRDQYHRAADIVPTILDCAAIDPPQIIKGHAQAPMHGVSMRYSFTAPEEPGVRRARLCPADAGRGEVGDVAARYPEQAAELASPWAAAADAGGTSKAAVPG
jgi:arylsulfatase A-like enzyme